MEATGLAGATFPATKAETALGRERGTDKPVTTGWRDEENEVEKPVPILGVYDGVVIVVVQRELEAVVTPRSKRFSAWSLD